MPRSHTQVEPFLRLLAVLPEPCGYPRDRGVFGFYKSLVNMHLLLAMRILQSSEDECN